MRKLAKRVLIWLMAAVVVILVVLPFALPPLVENAIVHMLASSGIPATVAMRFGYAWRNGPGIEGGLTVALAETPCVVRAKFGASCCEWSARVKMDETSLAETDQTVAKLLARYPVSVVSNLVFSGKFAFEARAERTYRTPVPVWSVRLPIRNLCASALVEDCPSAFEGLSVTLAASGIADHLDIAPARLHVRAIDAGGFAFTNFTASAVASERTVLVSEASAECCGGRVGFYALRLDPQSLNVGFTLFVDGVDAGAALSRFNGFRGEATGKLHGKARLFVSEGGKALRLGETFLHSIPGEGGKLRIAEPTVVTDNLALAGLDEATRANVAEVLTDVDYSVLRLNLARTSRSDARLSLVLCGTATRNGVSVPVDLTLNLNGAIEQLLNTGLGYSALLKGKRQ